MADYNSDHTSGSPEDEQASSLRASRTSLPKEDEEDELSKEERAALNRLRDRRRDYLQHESIPGETKEMATYKEELGGEEVNHRPAPLAMGEIDILDSGMRAEPSEGNDVGPPPSYTEVTGTWHMGLPGNTAKPEEEPSPPGNDIELRELDGARRSEPVARDPDVDLRQVEEGPLPDDSRSQTGDSDYQCMALGPFNRLGTNVAHLCLRGRRHLKGLLGNSPTRIILFTAAVTGIIALIFFLGLFPPSVITVEYYQVALKKSRITGAIDRSDVLMSGCHVLTPDVELVIFNATGQILNFDIDVFTIDSLVIDMEMAVVYFLKPTEIARLHSKFEMKYEDTFLSVIRSTIKNAAMQYNREDYRLRRRTVEQHFFSLLRRKLGGDCCAACCPNHCSNNSVCVGCQPEGQCDEAYHADVQQVYLMNVDIPNEVQERYMQRALLQIGEERELFIQQHKVTEKETLRQTSSIRNAAAEKIANGTHQGYVISQAAEAEKEVVVQTAYSESLKSTFSLLNITREDYKASLMMMSAFEGIADNLYSYDYQVLTAYTP